MISFMLTYTYKYVTLYKNYNGDVYNMDAEEREKILEELKQEYPILEQTTFNEFNLSEKLRENMKLRVRYQELYEHNSFIYNNLKEKYDELKGKRYDY